MLIHPHRYLRDRLYDTDLIGNAHVFKSTLLLVEEGLIKFSALFLSHSVLSIIGDRSVELPPTRSRPIPLLRLSFSD